MAHTYEFYATREDLLALLGSVESMRSIQYVRAGLRDHDTPMVAHAARDIEGLGFATFGDQNHEPILLAVDAGWSVNVRSVPQRKGGVKYAIDQSNNPDSIVIKAGGEYGAEVLIAGQIGTVSRSARSISLIRLFGGAIRRDYERVRSYYLGKSAIRALDAGLRLTSSIHAPRLCDLRR